MERVKQMENEKIVTRVNTVSLGEDGIVRIIHVPGAEVTLEDAEETMVAYLKINEGKRHPLFVDTKLIKSLARGPVNTTREKRRERSPARSPSSLTRPSASRIFRASCLLRKMSRWRG